MSSRDFKKNESRGDYLEWHSRRSHLQVLSFLSSQGWQVVAMENAGNLYLLQKRA